MSFKIIVFFFRNNRNRYKFVDSRQAHVCPYCLNVLRTRYSLQKHISVKHLRHKPFSCTECNKTFSNNCDLKRHRSNSHAQQKMVKCEICNKEFRSGYLARHRQFAHSKRNTPSTCDKCYKVFKTREIMLQHSRLKHSWVFQAQHSFKRFLYWNIEIYSPSFKTLIKKVLSVRPQLWIACRGNGI